MGRLDDALRRSGAPDAVTPSESSGGDVFVSPWSVSTDPPSHSSESPSSLASSLFGEAGAVSSPGFRTDRAELLAVSKTADPSLSDQFRRLAATLHNAQGQTGLKLVMVTSAVPGEGKTLTAMNLAAILSQSYRRRVLLIDADLRRPSLHLAAGVAGDRGLSDVLRASVEEKLAVFRLSETLTLLPAGRPEADPTSGLTSDRMRTILEEAKAAFDWVILDTPPITSVADASLLTSMVDAVLFVVRAGQTPFAIVRQALETMDRERIFGVVLNGADAGDLRGYGYHRYGYSGKPGESVDRADSDRQTP